MLNRLKIHHHSSSNLYIPFLSVITQGKIIKKNKLKNLNAIITTLIVNTNKLIVNIKFLQHVENNKISLIVMISKKSFTKNVNLKCVMNIKLKARLTIYESL